MRRISACRHPLTGTSMSRYLPPIGTAGFERVAVSGKRRAPWPPPRMMASVSLGTAGRRYFCRGSGANARPSPSTLTALDTLGATLSVPARRSALARRRVEGSGLRGRAARQVQLEVAVGVDELQIEGPYGKLAQLPGGSPAVDHDEPDLRPLNEYRPAVDERSPP